MVVHLSKNALDVELAVWSLMKLGVENAVVSLLQNCEHDCRCYVAKQKPTAIHCNGLGDRTNFVSCWQMTKVRSS